LATMSRKQAGQARASQPRHRLPPVCMARQKMHMSDPPVWRCQPCMLPLQRCPEAGWPLIWTGRPWAVALGGEQ